jgi:uncharacterized membrane protein YbaN (DUF454 family)
MTESRRPRRRPLHLAIRHWPRGARIAAAVVFLLVGLSGIVLPGLPGWPFLFLALAILTTVSPTINRVWRRFLRRHPKVRSALKKFRLPAASAAL